MHKFSELIKAWADGAVIQVKGKKAKRWKTLKTPRWTDNMEYRIKPEEDEILELTNYYHVAASGNIHRTTAPAAAHFKILFDGKTNKIKALVWTDGER